MVPYWLTHWRLTPDDRVNKRILSGQASRLPYAHINMAARLIVMLPLLLAASPIQGSREGRPYMPILVPLWLHGRIPFRVIPPPGSAPAYPPRTA